MVLAECIHFPSVMMFVTDLSFVKDFIRAGKLNSPSCSATFPKCKGLSNKLLPFAFNTVSNKRGQKLP